MRCPEPSERHLGFVGAAWLAAASLACVLAGCTAFETASSAVSNSGSRLSSLLASSGTAGSAVAAPQPGEEEYPDCPNVLVSEGGASVRQGSNQLAIANIARECTVRPGGAIVIKVGVEGRALAGPGGGSVRFDVPLTFSITRGDTVIITRSRRVSAAIAAGQVQGGFTVVETNLVVPPGSGDFDIYVGFGGTAGRGSRPAATPRRRPG